MTVDEAIVLRWRIYDAPGSKEVLVPPAFLHPTRRTCSCVAFPGGSFAFVPHDDGVLSTAVAAAATRAWLEAAA